jgi:hypothetical protein
VNNLIVNMSSVDSYKYAWRNFSRLYGASIDYTAYTTLLKRMHYSSLICDKVRSRLHTYPNVVGVGVSLKVKHNEVTNTPCIVVFVGRKLKPELLPKAIPKEVEGVPTDVVEAGEPVLRHFIRPSPPRPIPPGYSIGHISVTAGTLGCLVRDRDAKEILILSNNHVMANFNNASIGDPIVQPGPYDGGQHPADTIATLLRFKQVVQRGNIVDAAVARPIKPNVVVPSIAGGIGIPTGVRRVNMVGIYVQKAGRTTQHTTGIVVAYNASIYPLNWPGLGSVEFLQCIVTTGMSAGGDSGSLLLDFDKRAVGLLFAAIKIDEEDVVTYYNDIINVQNELNVDVLTK